MFFLDFENYLITKFFSKVAKKSKINCYNKRQQFENKMAGKKFGQKVKAKMVNKFWSVLLSS